MSVQSLLPFLLLAPLGGIVLNLLGYRSFRESLAGWIGTVAVLISTVAAWLIFFVYTAPVQWELYSWIDTNLFEVTIGFYVDWLTVLMLVVVSSVSACVHLYSIEYMAADEGFNRFFIYMNLFVFLMFVLVSAHNLPVLFIGWEGVGLCSYLLIGFWYRRSSARQAGQKAFVVNRLGDICFLLGMILCLIYFGTFTFSGIERAVTNASSVQLLTVGLLLFGGVIGKSAQFPLHVWLPDAMEGPTPVSSLIHAATMVTAGVYLVARFDFLFSPIPVSGRVIAAVGAFTALFAATVACSKEDMKRILAYSTISQLGYMFVGVGMGAYGAGLFHLMTHACFKGLLFLVAGSVMHALHGELNIFRMDGLWDQLPVTGSMALAGGLGLSGFPLISGFWSKDEILLASIGRGDPFEWILFSVLSFAALLTAYYTFRMIFVAFFTDARDETDYDPSTVHEPGWKMVLAMGLLAAVTVIGGYMGYWTSRLTHGHSSSGYHTIVTVVSVVVSLLGIGLSYFVYVSDYEAWMNWPEVTDRVRNVVREQFYVETFYRLLFINPLRWLSRIFWRIVDDLIVDGMVNLTGVGVDITGLLLRFFQTGFLRHYLIYLATGFSIILSLFVVILWGV